jgi:hypothetical protein
MTHFAVNPGSRYNFFLLAVIPLLRKQSVYIHIVTLSLVVPSQI